MPYRSLRPLNHKDTKIRAIAWPDHMERGVKVWLLSCSVVEWYWVCKYWVPQSWPRGEN